MLVSGTPLEGVRLVEPEVRRDARGAFHEAWRSDRYGGLTDGRAMVQCNVSRSIRGVVRGLHLQHPHGQAKLIGVIHGAVFDVAVDVRRGSATFGRWFGAELSAETARQLVIPEGVAHGFQALTAEAVVMYLTTELYNPAAEIIVRWDDPAIGVAWPLPAAALSDRDRSAPVLQDVLSRLPSV